MRKRCSGYIATLLALGGAWIASSAGEPSAPLAQLDLTADAPFDVAQVPADKQDHTNAYRYIDSHLPQHVANLQRWVRQPSVSAQNDGITAMAELVLKDLQELGFASEIFSTKGHPGVWGYYNAGAPRSLLVYFMYDVQPVIVSDWQVPPFEGRLVEQESGRVLMARGATNQKGPERAFLNAIETIRAVAGRLPVNLMIVAEGEEELGSPHLPDIVEHYENSLRKANGVFFPFNSQDASGRLNMPLGAKGILYFEMEARGGEWGGPTRGEIHSSYKALVDSPTWRLVQALASLTTPDGNVVQIPGFYQDVRPPSPLERRLIVASAEDWNETQLQRTLGVKKWIDGVRGTQAFVNLLYLPTLNIDGIWSGYTGEAVKTILPDSATAKLDARLPPEVDPETTLARLRQHLDDHGFAEIRLRKLSGYPASQTSVDSPFVRSAIGVFNKRGHRPSIRPRTASSAPFYLFTKRLGLPLVVAGLGYGAAAHAPNEFMVIEPPPGSAVAGLAEIEKGYVDLIYAFSRAPSAHK